jgi:hypothetical protein
MAQWRTQKSTQIGALLPGLLGAATQKFGFPVAALVADWRTIAGDALADRCLPRSLEKRSGGPRGRSGATLVVAARPEDVLEIDYARDMIRQRVNDYLGRPFLGAVRVLKDVDLKIENLEQSAATAHLPEPSPEIQARVHDQTDIVSDPGLRATLERLGHAMHGMANRKSD